jgi:hypothetical protein
MLATNLVGPRSILVSTSVHSAVRWRLPIDICAHRDGGPPVSERAPLEPRTSDFRSLLNQRFILLSVEMYRPNVRAMERAKRHA